MGKFVKDIKTDKENRYVETSVISVEEITDDRKVVCDALGVLRDLQETYSKSFIYLYKYPFTEEKEDKDKYNHFQDKFYSQYKAVSWLIHSEIIDYSVTVSMNNAIKNKKLKEIEKLKNQLKKKEDALSKVEKALSKARSKNKTYIKNLGREKSIKKDITELKLEIRDKEKIASRDVTFGCKKEFRYINKLEYYTNNILPQYKDFSLDEINSMIADEQKSISEKRKNKEKVDYKRFRTLSQVKAFKENANLLQEKKDEYRNNRIRPIFISGEASQQGNRWFDFHHLSEGILYFYFNKKTYQITFEPGNRIDILTLMAALASAGKTAISVKMDFRENKMSIQFGYNVRNVNNYLIDTKTVRDTLESLTDKQFNDIDLVYDLLYSNVIKRKDNARLKWNRVIGVDLNPDNVGISIIKRTGMYTYKVLYYEVLYYHELIRKLGVKSSDPKQIKQNNKLCHEIIKMSQYIFRLAVHYRCNMFVCESLEFDNDDEKTKETNRKCMNMWHRTLFDEMFRKQAAKAGMKFRKINAAYSSFIGNIQHRFPDAAAAATEIARRGMFSYVKNSFCPKKTENDDATLRTLFGDELNPNDLPWDEIYDKLKEMYGPVKMNRLFRYGNVDDASLKRSRLLSHSSKIKSVRCGQRTPEIQ